MSSQPDYERVSSFDEEGLQYHLPQYYRALLHNFRKITASFVSFNLCFSLLIFSEIFLIFFFFSFLNSRSSLFALGLGAILLTCFTYFVLLFYYQAKKPEELHRLKDQFLHSCRQFSEHHLPLAESLSKLSTYLQDFESNFYKIPPFLNPLSNLIRKFSASCYGEDVFRMKQLLLHTAVEEHLKQIRISPTDLEVHASLANHYVMLSRLYKESLKMRSHRKLSSFFEERFRLLARLAIEEFRILNHYAPNDPWVHEQLAAGYCNLEMPEEEIREVEFLSKLRPQDQEILFRLGTLYFQQGQNAKGLQIYESLKSLRYKKADDLIENYGSPIS